MSFLLDTNICSGLYRWPGKMAHRFQQHAGSLYLSTIVLGELLTWYHHRQKRAVLDFVRDDLLPEVIVVDFDGACAEIYGSTRGNLLRQGISVAAADLLIACTALAYDLTMVTDNTADFSNIPGLRLENWLAP